MVKMKIIFCLGFIILIVNSCTGSISSNISEASLPYGYQTPVWQKIFQIIDEKRDLLPVTYSGPRIQDDKNCILCNLVVGAVLTERGFGMTNVQLAAEIQYFCSPDFLNIEDDRVCEGLVWLNLDSIAYIMDNQKTLNAQKVCNFLLNCPADASNSFDWTIEIPEGVQVEKKISDGSTSFNIVHLTDIHYDPNYAEGKKLDCGEPTCCQKDQMNATGDDIACGYWSSVHTADVPLHLIDATIDKINTQEYKYVYYTGDIVAHRVWDTSIEFNSGSISQVLDMFAEKFKTKVFPILGNHETHPVNIYAPINITEKTISNQWLFDLIVEKWSVLLGKDIEEMNSIKETVLKGGYYTVSPEKGFRIIVLNNNVCQLDNWWLLYDDYDPYGQLEWLVKVLTAAEKNQEMVHILLHVPNKSCLHVWGREYRRIILRFSNIIAAQFNGHTHRDQFHIFYDSEKPVSVVMNGGSLMPDFANPNYKVYKVESTQYYIMDAELYTFDLEAANKSPKNKLEWYKLYSFKEEFGVENLLPSELDGLYTRMTNDPKLATKYYNYYFRNSTKGNEECVDDCIKRYLCEIITTVKDDDVKC